MAPGDPPDPLDALRDTLDATRQAAERIAAGVDADGFRTTEDGRAAADEVEQLASVLRALRDLVPAELVEQVREVLRGVLLLLRAIIDWWVERLELGEGGRPPAQPRVAEDIPIA